MHFNKPPVKPVDNIGEDDNDHLSVIGKLVVDSDNSGDDGDYDNSSLLAIDTLKIDNHSRLTLTKKVRGIFPLKSGDIIALYQDTQNGYDIILKVQRQSKVVDIFKITRQERTDAIKRRYPHSSSSLDKIKELGTPKYNYHHGYPDSPNKRYLPNIVLIDDDPDILVTFQAYLSSEGFNAQTFSKPDEALKFLVSHSDEHRVVITDIRMPGLNGIELYQTLKKSLVNKNMKVIFISALDAAEELLSLLPDIGKRDIIRKPIQREEFVNKVKSAIFD